MRVLQVCHHFHPCVGGIERHVEDLCLHLAADGHQADVLCLETCSRREKLPPSGVHRGIRIRRIPYLDLGIYKIAPSILRYIAGYDLIHIHGLGFFSDFLALTKTIHRKPLVLSTHGGIFHTRRMRALKNLYFRFWFRLLQRAFDGVVAVSEADRRLFSTVCPRVTLIPNAIEVGDPPQPRRAEGNTFLYVGRFSRNKRLDNLLRTFSFLRLHLPDLRLYILGEDWEGIRGELEALVREGGLGGNVLFPGLVISREELRQYYSKARFFVSASDYEGFGLALLEAMAMGMVPIVNDIEAFRELVRGGEEGFLIDYSNPKKAAETILEIVGKEQAGVAERARRKAEGYRWEKVIRRFEELYEVILG